LLTHLCFLLYAVCLKYINNKPLAAQQHQSKTNPLWGLSVYIHPQRDLTSRIMVSSAGMKVPAGQAGIGRLKKSASYFLSEETGRCVSWEMKRKRER
jgi:acyl CoA:acetate/3-ketoacid CoA transferase alpha subunit